MIKKIKEKIRAEKAYSFPTSLIYFKAICNSEKVSLDWETASEKNCDYFTIQKSYDGLSFVDIALMKAAGTKTTNSKYNWIDSNPFSGASYYRLKQTDYDGESKTYNIVSANCKSNVSVVAYNNNEGSIVVTINTETSANFSTTIYNALGSKIMSKALFADEGNNVYKLDISSLTSGVYFVSIVNNQLQTTQKIIVK